MAWSAESPSKSPLGHLEPRHRTAMFWSARGSELPVRERRERSSERIRETLKRYAVLTGTHSTRACRQRGRLRQIFQCPRIIHSFQHLDSQIRTGRGVILRRPLAWLPRVECPVASRHAPRFIGGPLRDEVAIWVRVRGLPVSDEVR